MADEIPEAVLDTAAAALVNFSLGAGAYDTLADFQRTHWRRALAAALPPLVAERDAEITRLRAELSQQETEIQEVRLFLSRRNEDCDRTRTALLPLLERDLISREDVVTKDGAVLRAGYVALQAADLLIRRQQEIEAFRSARAQALSLLARFETPSDRGRVHALLGDLASVLAETPAPSAPEEGHRP